MDQIFENLSTTVLLNTQDVLYIIFSILLSVAIAIVISQVYKRTHRGMNYELSFMSTLVLLAPIVTLVMMFIRGDLVLSLGLIGSLSIIRFRTPIKDTRDMVFLFWTIAVGLGSGTYNWTVVILANLMMIPLVFLLYYINYGRTDQADFVLVCSGKSDYPIDKLDETIKLNINDANIRSHEIDGTFWEAVFELRVKKATGPDIKKLINDIKSIKGVDKISLLAPKLDLPV